MERGKDKDTTVKIRRLLKVVCSSPTGWSKVPGIFLNSGVCPVMRFAFLIPAITAFGIAGCQVTPPATTAPVSAPPATTAPVVSGASEGAADAVMETGAQTDNDDVTTVDPDVTTANQDDVLSTPQEAAAESVTLDNAAKEVAPETKADEQTAGLPVTEAANAPTDAPTNTPVGASADNSGDDDQTNDADGTPDIVPANPAPQVTTESGAETFETEAKITDEAVLAATDLALATPPPPPPPPPPPELAPQALIGLDTEGLQQRLGDADFKRREGPVETWQYRFPICVIDYFLYSDATKPEVRNWAWRSPVIGGTLDSVACRRALAKRERTD